MKSSGNWRVLVDCSTFLSGAFYPQGKPRKILHLWQEEEIEVVVTDAILGEYERKIVPLANRLKRDLSLAKFYLELIETESERITPRPVNPKICRDLNDLMYLEAAASSEADFLISSDKDLLILKKFDQTKILNPSEFLEIFMKKQR